MGIEDLALIITGIVTLATAITAVTPTTADNSSLDKFLAVINVLAGNFGKNTNQDAEK